MKLYCPVCNQLEEKSSSASGQAPLCEQCGGKLTVLDGPHALASADAARPSKTGKKQVVPGFVFLGIYLVYAILTGGIYFTSGAGFGGQRSVVLSDRAKVGLWLRPTMQKGGLLFVAGWHKTGAPYTPQVFLHKLDASYQSAQISEASVEYKDGTIVIEKGLVSRDVMRRKGRSEATFWSGPPENLITRDEDCTLTVKGRFTLADGSTEDFAVTKEFPALPKSFQVGTYWMALARKFL